MKKISLFFLTLVMAALSSTGFAENLVLDNETSFPSKEQSSKMAVQWASSSKEVDEGNSALIKGDRVKAERMHLIKQTGKTTLTIPKKAEYFRVLVWSSGKGNPDLVTNWVEVVPEKTYSLKQDHLSPTVLMLGTGC